MYISTADQNLEKYVIYDNKKKSERCAGSDVMLILINLIYVINTFLNPKATGGGPNGPTFKFE